MIVFCGLKQITTTTYQYYSPFVKSSRKQTKKKVITLHLI